MLTDEYALDIHLCDPDGSSQAVNAGDFDSPLESGHFLWQEIKLYEEPNIKVFSSDVGLNTTIAESLVTAETRPRCTVYSSGTLLNLRGVNLNPNSDPSDMISIRLWIEKDRIVTVQRRNLMAVLDLKEKYRKDAGPGTVGNFVTYLANRLVDRTEDIIENVSDEIDAFESDEQFDNLTQLSSTLIDRRRFIINLRRYIGPQREALSQLMNANVAWLSNKDKMNLREIVDHVTRFIEDLDLLRERINLLNSQILEHRADQQNKNMLLLSIVAAIFLPLSFITGLFGVNIGGMPGTDNPFAFLLFCIVLVALGAVTALIFRLLRWI